MNKLAKHLILAFFSALLLLATLFIDVKSERKEDLENIRLGYPFSFVSQNHVQKYSFYYFPTWDRFDFGKWKEAENFSPVNFAGSFLAIFLALETVIWILEMADFWVRKRFFEKEVKAID